MALARIAGFVRLRRVGRRGSPDQGLPGEEEDLTPEWGLPEGERPEVEPPEPPDEIPGLPEVPEQGPVLPGRPGHPLPRPPVPVVAAVPLPEGEELPTGPPYEPGCVCVVVEGKSNKKALGWLQGMAALPKSDDGTPPSKPSLGGHWVCVDADPQHRGHCLDDRPGQAAFAFVWEIGGDFGRPPPAGGIGGRPPQRPPGT